LAKLERPPSRIELSNNETQKLMKLLDEATAIMPYSDSMYFDDFNADSRD